MQTCKHAYMLEKKGIKTLLQEYNNKNRDTRFNKVYKDVFENIKDKKSKIRKIIY